MCTPAAPPEGVTEKATTTTPCAEAAVLAAGLLRATRAATAALKASMLIEDALPRGAALWADPLRP